MLTIGRARLKAGDRRGRRRGRDPRPGRDRGAARRLRGHSAPGRAVPRHACWRRWTSTRCSRAGRGLALVDELAHTNAPGSRHPKRYQDVEELLDAGIDVYTTLNIQHVESLNDVVAQITRIRVRETVPDGVLDRADDIEVIDLNPDDLIQRLKDGKVYVPTQRRAGAEALLLAAATSRPCASWRCGAPPTGSTTSSSATCGPTPSPAPGRPGERVLVCVSEDPRSAGLVRYAKRLADRLHAPWTALSIEGRARPS